jgi:hypothetical protein
VTSCAPLAPLAPLAGCIPNCDRKVCGDDGCGGRCGTCDIDQVCANGRCASSCPRGQKNCAGNCIPNNQCCTDADCSASTPTCCGGACLDLLADERNCGACGARCSINETCVGGGCLCGTDACSTVNPGFSCCLELAGGGPCGGCSGSDFLILDTCAKVSNCPSGTTECTGTSSSGPTPITCKACCPLGTTCTATGTCLIN